MYAKMATSCLCLNVLIPTKRVDGNADILSHHRPQQHPLSQGHIVVVFYIRACYRLPSLSFHDNQASHSQDTIWPWKFKVKGTPVSTMSSWLISIVFHIRACYRLPSLSFYDNRASHSRDTIWPWKFKVKGTPVSAASSWLISIVFHFRASYRLLSLSFHDSQASHSRDTIWPWKFKVKGQGQRYPSQRSIQLTHFLFVPHQLDQPFLRYGK